MPRAFEEAMCERLIPTMSPKAISNHINFLGGWCNYLDWCHQFTLVRISVGVRINK